ncbi:hypothetical protein GGR50DRAFT_664932 [Xylaria sp. CBS 124048]|nr:hypothetical protein GGR50DRAFT_664932 [Xylaria sp. CBS 124048]
MLYVTPEEETEADNSPSPNARDSIGDRDKSLTIFFFNLADCRPRTLPPWEHMIRRKPKHSSCV